MEFIITLIAIAVGAAGYSRMTNPFSRLSIIRLPYRARLIKSTVEAIDRNQQLTVRQAAPWRMLAIVNSGLNVLYSRYVKSPAAEATTVDGIIKDIHQLRFDPAKLLVTSGDHFSSLFVRNLGVFYYPLLDPNIESTKQDWQNRQLVYLQSVAYALGVYAKQPVPSTTIVPMGPLAATCVNFYAYPSDTVYGVMYALAVLSGQEASWGRYEYTAERPKSLSTKLVANGLIATYRQTLQTLYKHYRETVFNDATGLIRQDIHLSGAKDITRRQGAFYDNVIFWKTTQLAMTLGIIEEDSDFLAKLKHRIIETYWYEKGGYFLEDLSEAGLREHYYSSDWLVVLFTGFLSVDKKQELHYFECSLAYIEHAGINKPFGLKYQHETRANRQFLAVRVAVASYGGDAIWSFWGMEYIKCLLLLYRSSKKPEYLREADKQIESYKRAMVRDGGFPEVYDKDGNLLQTLLYRSIRQTGWVVGFEQALALRNSLND